MHKAIPILFALILITTGCISSVGTGTVTTAPTATPQVTTTAAPPVLTATSAQVTTVPTASPTTVPTTAAPTKPLASTVTLTGIGSGFASFTTQAPGKVTVEWRYGSKYGGEKCAVVGRSARLAGASFEADLPIRADGDAIPTTFNLITPGTYKIQITGCYGWEVKVNNG